MTSQFRASSSGDVHAMPPSSFSVSPRDIVRFQYLSAGRLFCVMCFWILRAIARPIEPRPIHPSCDGFTEDMMCRFVTLRIDSLIVVLRTHEAMNVMVQVTQVLRLH